MPIVQVNLLGGRSEDELRRLAQAITRAVTDCTGVRPEAVRVLIHEIAAGRWFTGGEAVPPPRRGD